MVRIRASVDLPRPGFADDGERLSSLKRERHAGERLDDARAAEEAAPDLVVRRRSLASRMASLRRRSLIARQGLPAHERRVATRVAKLGARAAAARVDGSARRRMAQRGENRQPRGRSNWPGTTPGIAGSRRPSRAQARRRGAPPYRDGEDRRRDRASTFFSTCWPAYWTMTRSAVSATTPMS